ncbi:MULTISPECIES: phosphate signaling complex protein PhoU [Oceanobacillus]|uniref:Phosphate-specific transport system accessory protein PhoU n=1 Tax=Oceanobacillus kimchii TaxID=746691 RepID=A0ABQ5TLS5_9BACI|nr:MULTISPECIES: phosphate signaling complex protein PhoU [Oceanobacillus]MBT2598319.1 phosphate signaling complex protein PhoU [Oceanobacillus sp. ISL-74]MBT2651238.1 phosphate signaling complex protein PhoU [Oceanobacillus sp. ISL-73]OEH55638.1 transcriptional regulator [Oceanobacillus sp. E9]GLO66583.1 phosphate transport system regulatory protein PhoU [Oceanobacillus kimchii]
MSTRNQFQDELQELYADILHMADLVGEALDKSMESLIQQQQEMAENVIAKDNEIDKLEQSINDKAILLIAKQQPVATDLRRIVSALRVMIDIERMGDNAKNIAKSSIRLLDNPSSVPPDLSHMHHQVKKMLHTAVLAFEQEDISLAGKLAELDDEVDRVYKRVVSDLLYETATRPDQIEYVMQMSFCARYLERFADHITNIGESILYMVKGESVNLNK